MNFNIVKRQIITEYLKLYGSDRESDQWSLGACLDVFRYYFNAYRDYFGVDHPKLSNSTIKNIITAFPYVQDPERSARDFDLEPQDYPELIKAYFKQDFDKCNYSIAHFMSGDIRALRYYEELY